ncbi:hypothetical protein [Ruminiclostridium papyrosolvens]|uniref:Uncharacterized protein n=1 Tax=Ruminiclostridium papyrosolvens C7 TaxID=1330534 RepID=U4R293_9FIRM|nr:hypothetical protein [Ruminiclostridium papyrosolvens]EPR12355.1 hypothetical protein L323_08625 [Ruminiclostridium papyrosolvens C7]
MAFYLAWQIEEGKLDYKTVFSAAFFKPYKSDTDNMLIADGRQDLIVDIP